MHQCPICKVESKYATPRFICLECRDKAVDKKGRKIKFYNYQGEGYLAVCQETGEESIDHICFVSGVKCIANTHRLGGVEVQTYEGWLPYKSIEPIDFSSDISKRTKTAPVKHRYDDFYLICKRKFNKIKANKYTDIVFVVLGFPILIIFILSLMSLILA